MGYNLLKKQAVLIFSGVFILIFWTSCFRRFSLNDSKIEKHYTNSKTEKPRFGSYFVDGIPMHYAEVGNDSLPLLLFIHGAPGAWYGYMKQLDDTVLQKNFHIISVDRAGYGKSGFGKAITSIRMQADLIKPILKKYASKAKAIVVGRSFGAPVAAKLVADNNENVKSLILIGADMDPEKEKFWWFSKLGTYKIIKWFLPTAMNIATDEKFSRIDELKKMKEEWSKILVPVTALHGKDDWIVDTSNVNFLRKCLRNTIFRSKIIEQTGHLVSVEKPEIVKEEIFFYNQPINLTSY